MESGAREGGRAGRQKEEDLRGSVLFCYSVLSLVFCCPHPCIASILYRPSTRLLLLNASNTSC